VAHDWKCNRSGADDVWEKMLCDFEGWFNTMKMDPNLQHPIFVHLRSWRNDTLTITAPTAFLEEILNSQRAISWQRFFEGWISNDWSATQQDYYMSTKCL
jgi:hypothetical protein